MALGQSFLFGVFLITITSFFHLDTSKYLEIFLFLIRCSNSQCIYGQIFTVVTWNVSTHAPPEASVNVDGPSVWKVSKSNLKAQISKKGEKNVNVSKHVKSTFQAKTNLQQEQALA